ncbi:MAG: beta-lactamase [Phenylobacterium sp.]|nr:beta-lactamase [Phenylobacterium sp.]
MGRRGFWRRRPRAAAGLGVAALLAAAGAGGWLAYGDRLAASPAKLTSLTPTPAQLKVRLPGPPAPAELQEKLADLAEAYREPVGIAVTDVTARWTAQVAGEEVFPQQSVSKLWVALSVMQAVDHKGMSLDQQVVLTPDDRSVFYQPLASHIRGPNGFSTTVYDLLRRQLTESDNAANDKLIRELGGGGSITRTLTQKGLEGLGVGETERELQTRTAGLTWRPEYGQTWIFKQAREQLPEAVRDAALADYLAHPADGAKPAAITETLAALQRGELLSPASTQLMLELMAQCRTGSSRLRAGLPRDWTIAHKTGTGPDWRGASVGINDVGLITAPDGHAYAVAVMMRETRKPFGARHALMQKVARAVVDHWRSGPAASVPEQRVASAGVASGAAR